jgi:hypothetical protein
MQLSDLIGDQVVMLIPKLHPTIFQKVKLLSVETGGIWIESQDVMNKILEGVGVSSSPQTLALFLPYPRWSLQNWP